MVVPVVVLLLVEGVLRVAGYGVSVDFYRRASVGGAERFLSNPHFGRAFFPPQLRRECLPFSLPVEKTPGMVRIFLLGASAAAGVPEPAYGMGRILETMLRDQYPGVQFEVVNVAITAVNSHVVREVAKSCRDLSPDLFLVYLGNNEVVGPYGAGTVFSPLAASMRMIHLDIALKSTRLGQLINATTRRLVGRDDEPAGWRGMEMFLANQVRASDPRMELVYSHFQQNLEDVCAMGREAGVPVVLGTVAVNLRDSGPFASQHAPGLSTSDVEEWEEHFRRGRELMGQGDFATALQALADAERLDADFAALHFLMARCLERLGDDGAARDRFERARDLDTLRFRADGRILEIIRRVGEGRATQGIHLVDVESTLAAVSPHGIPGRELFHEHVHLDFAGNYRVAQAFFDVVRRILPEAIRRRASGRPLPTQEECARRLAFTPWDERAVLTDVRAMIEGPPFVQQIDHEEQVAFVEGRLRVLEEDLPRSSPGEDVPSALREMARTYETALLEHDTHWLLHHRYAKFQLEALGNAAAAQREWRRLMAELPQFALAPSYLAGALAAQQRYAEALALWRRSLEMNPYQADVHNNVGNCLVLLSPDERAARLEAIEHYRAAYTMAPSENALRNRNRALFDESLWLLQRERFEEAKGLLREIVESDPDFPEAHFNLAGVLEQEGDRDGALREYREVLRIVPGHEAAQRRIARLRP